jgi:PDZ domain-containing protein
VAARGPPAPDGTVIPIGGVKQKTYGAREAKADVFLVPAGENARDARRYAGRLRIIPVSNFQQALRALATLPPKR